MNTAMVVEVLFWIGMLILIAFLGARLVRRMASEAALLDASLDETFERYRVDRDKGTSRDQDQAA